MSEGNIVWIFYSSKTEPELLTFYADGLAYLRDQEIGLEVIDVSENMDKAQEYKVKSTPTVLIEKGDEIKERYEVISYLSGILEKKELERIFE
ncbi:thioredoxin family protein [Methanonatronarchaeum sp. AMET-Sl]|uniref:thioredoxin family protein n=1 Tax=Methanonatronarchaeum sp. AMET-Sl TaxID=3037654 RepID=UPI00244DF141|nr:thioredoxin family protein [Methanonatronarchaeum sp. AMET-Sl]WGI17724.1 thioredoxin family protein [Methanonatronarchaeum sp. AMET-Sl]